MATITFTDINHVFVNGADRGHILDLHISDSRLHADIKAAFDTWVIGHLSDVSEARMASERAVLAAETRALASAEGAVREIDRIRTEADAAVAILGTKEEARTMLRDRRRRELLAQKAAIEAEIAAVEP